MMSSHRYASHPTTPPNLNNLPEVPLLRILRFLDGRTLEEMRRTGRWMNGFIVNNRNDLVLRKLWSIIIYHKSFENSEKTHGTHAHIYFSDAPGQGCDGNVENSISGSSWFLWLTKRFSNTYVGILNVDRICLDELEFEGMEAVMKKSKIVIRSIKLFNTMRGPAPSDIIRFLSIVRPSVLGIARYGNSCQEFDLLFTDSFFIFVSRKRLWASIHHFTNYSFSMATLDKLSIDSTAGMAMIDFPDQAYKIPRTFHTLNSFVMPLSTVTKTIRDWYDGDKGFGSWRITLARDVCPDLDHMATEIRLPWHNRLCSRNSTFCYKIVIRNRGQKKNISIYNEPGREANGTTHGTINWTIEHDSHLHDLNRQRHA